MEKYLIWPAFLFPQEDELLSSWMVRVAHNHGEKIYTFYKPEAGEYNRLWVSDIDSSCSDIVIKVLSEKTNIAIERIQSMLLTAYNGTLFEKKNRVGCTRWILALGIRSSITNKYGLMFCPKCLKNDGLNPYFRKKWRLSLSVVCTSCECYLLDRCPRCDRLISFIRGELGKKDVIPNKSIANCHNCDFDLRYSEIIKAEPVILCFQKQLYKYIEDGYTENCNYSILFFNGLYQIVRVLNSQNKKVSLLKQHLASLLNFNYDDKANYKFEVFEEKEINQRLQLLYMSNKLMEDWPHKFIDLCGQHHIWILTLFSTVVNEDQLPYWYWHVVTNHLNKRQSLHNRKATSKWYSKQLRLKTLKSR